MRLTVIDLPALKLNQSGGLNKSRLARCAGRIMV